MTTPGSSVPQQRRTGPRPKHVPQRMCISCREHSAKRTLIRIVRTPDGTIDVDPTGKRNGRGAYLCDDPACWKRALAGDGLARALKTSIDDQTTNALQSYADRLLSLPQPSAASPVREGTNE